MCVLIYEMYVQRIFIIEINFQKLLCTEKAQNFREFFGRNRPCSKMRLEYDFFSFLIFKDIQILKKSIMSLKNEYDYFSNERNN